MARLTIDQALSVATSGGFRGGALITAVAVAKAESGLRTDEMGDTSIQTAKWGPSVGLWQIRSLKAQKGTGGTRDADALLSALHNARSAFSISAGGLNWLPWTVYKTGAYKAHVPAVKAAFERSHLNAPGVVQELAEGAVEGAIGGAKTAKEIALGPANLVGKLLKPGEGTANVYVRASMIVVGATFGIVGVILFALQTGAGKRAVAALPSGRVAGAVQTVAKLKGK